MSTTTTMANEAIDDSGEDVGDEFYFESDELALKGNADYLSLLRTVAVLEAQRAKAIKDIDRLVEGERMALANPIRFVERLQNGKDNSTLSDLPGLQQIATLPIIDWEKYAKSFSSLVGVVGPCYGAGAVGSHRHMTRQIKKRVSIGSAPADSMVVDGTAHSSSASSTVETILETIRNDLSVSTAAIDSASSMNQLVVRGRLCNFGKPQTFNQLWTVEEQKRLEDLLVKFPPEEVEARRWEKVATALGNRTPQQVASRVQKYFIKLTKAGLPVPGRIPNLSSYSRRPFSQNNHYHKQHRHNRFLFGSSTFLASHEPPVFMSDIDDMDTLSNIGNFSSNDIDWNVDPDDDDDDDDDDEGGNDDDDDIPIELRHTDEYRELLLLRRMKRKKISNEDVGQHFGFRCDRCNCEPIVGNRWHCVTCPSDVAVDLCETCVSSNFENGVHNSSHCMEPIRNSHVDGDYTQFLQGDYNYLDPNYMPACS